MESVKIPEFKYYYNEKLYMTSDVETGVLFNRSGRRMIALTNDFIVGLHRALEKECGDRVAIVLMNCGKRWGKKFAESLDAAWSEFYEQPATEFPLAFFQSLLMQEFAHNGWGLLQIDYSSINNGVIALSLDGAIMGDVLGSNSQYPADVLTAGILAAIFSHFLGRDLGCIQTVSRTESSSMSRFLISEAEFIDALGALPHNETSHQAVLARLVLMGEK